MIFANDVRLHSFTIRTTKISASFVNSKIILWTVRNVKISRSVGWLFSWYICLFCFVFLFCWVIFFSSMSLWHQYLDNLLSTIKIMKSHLIVCFSTAIQKLRNVAKYYLKFFFLNCSLFAYFIKTVFWSQEKQFFSSVLGEFSLSVFPIDT